MQIILLLFHLPPSFWAVYFAFEKFIQVLFLSPIRDNCIVVYRNLSNGSRLELKVKRRPRNCPEDGEIVKWVKKITTVKCV